MVLYISGLRSAGAFASNRNGACTPVSKCNKTTAEELILLYCITCQPLQHSMNPISVGIVVFRCICARFVASDVDLSVIVQWPTEFAVCYRYTASASVLLLLIV